MLRYEDINSKFEYIETLRQNLFNDLFEAKKNKADVKSIIHTARTILAESRECYDYCMQDIFEHIVLPHSSNQHLLNLHRSRKLKLYFPFYSNQLEGDLWKEIKTIRPDLFQHFQTLVNNIDSNVQIPNTLYFYGSVLQLKDMVNEKKHDRLLAVQSEDEQEVLIDNENFKMILPVKQSVGLNRIRVSYDSELKLVSEFVFESNQQEINLFCMTALFVTRIVLNDIYSFLFSKQFIK